MRSAATMPVVPAIGTAAAQARTAAAFVALEATLTALATSTARIKAANQAAAAAQPPRPARTPSPLALLVWAAQQPK